MRAKAAFPRRNQQPKPGEFTARLPLPAGKRFEATRAFLSKQKGVTEELYYYGPRSGWAFRYLRSYQSICTVMVHGERPLGILSLDAATAAAVAWKALSPVGQKARRSAHGSPTLLWLDVPLDGAGAADFKALVKAKLRSMPEATAAPRGPARERY